VSTLTESQSGRAPRALGDRLFAGLARGAGVLILVALAAVFVFLLVKGIPGFSANATTIGQGFTSFWGVAWPLLFGTILIAVLALIIAVPFAIAIALFITYYAPRRLAAPIGYVIDLLAAVPSIVFGLWGGQELANSLKPVYQWLGAHASWFPLFKGPYAGTGRVGVTAVLVLAVMILPIVTAISREVFAQTPKLTEEAAVGLGATRWEVIRLSVFPHAKSGIVAGVMLGLGRALGETMAVVLVYSSSPRVTLNVISNSSPQTIASYIANNFAEANPDKRAMLIAAGLVLFALTFLVNFAARAVILRGERKFAR
jgi:phosphate transport system permease protein